jgi:hypothetical protein
MRILFVSDYNHQLKDGLWAAINILGYDRYNIGDELPNFEEYDFILGHGGFHSRVDLLLRSLPNKKGLCIGGNVHKQDTECYDVLFYETLWARDFLELKGNLVHAFGINTNIFNSNDRTLSRYKAIDILSVGAFATWKRHEKIINETGNRVVIGEIQKDNKDESIKIINELLSKGVGVIPQVTSEQLSRYYQDSKWVYIPATIYGGGERAVLEARNSSCMVKIEEDNPKLRELLNSPIYSEYYYAEQLKKGIEIYGKNV